MSKMMIAAAAMLVSGLTFAQERAMAPAPAELTFEQRDAIRQAVGNPTRRISNVMRDAYRNPEATLGFFAVAADHTVVEIWPGEGWYTEILAPLLHDEGRLIAAHFDPDSSVEFFRKSRAEFEKRLKQGRGNFDKVELAVLDYDPDHSIAEPATADRVLTFRNVHNWLAAGKEEAQTVFQKMYDVLKPGGYLGVVEHSARPGATLEDMIKTGYVSEALVVELATEAGFELASRSPVNQNPQDTKDYPEGVWTLPPTLRMGYENRAHYMAIGESDRMTLLFIKKAE